ncbi:MAG TPA: enoyl-[acyl-carrier-protein] reductase FabK [Halanaerobiaceae bacterium]|nr:enoyl-[acyl-carrier-protein] reductase FabK [Halanaerobiaceae bacterium]HOA40231.1 enoyl-[acyl-carrier-protein] reductase FabK [Halanaerobiales bacterium]HPZ62384.1 enoyl-[acyl-carrier-protein] reductase FabK [Halanaerobiales bacterium]HQD03782.1 enoyl-[acyl-carrier-protein] reductase FabK [Halanaerobiales bacterium]
MIRDNRLTDLLQIPYPILQGGMAWIATGELAAAVSNAGGLGIIGAGSAPADIIRNEIRKLKEVTDQPFAVNIMLLSPFVDEIVDLVIEEKVPVVTTGAGNPGKYIDRFKENGIKVIPVVPTVALARRMERIGADALIVEGTEAGGHIGDITTMALVPQVVDAVKIPVIAAGGIADGRGFLAALALGAEGIQMGTRFVASRECTAHVAYKEAIIKAGDRDAVVTGRSTGHPVRNLKNTLTRTLDEMEKKGVNKEEIEKLAAGSLRKAAIDGDIENGSVMAGQIAALIKEIKPVGEIIEEIVREAEELLQKLQEGLVR